MRKHLFYLAAAIVAMSSCTESEVVEVSQSKAIGFNGFVGNQTRAEQTSQTLETLKQEGNGFYVFGVYKEGEKEPTSIFDGKNEGSHVKWIGGEIDGSWGYSPVNYWLEGAIYKFAAYAPALSITPTFDYTNNQMKFTDFVANGATDLLVAEATTTGINGSESRKVGFTFKHALSKVRFTFVNGWRNEVTLNITNIELEGVNSKGTLTTPGTLQSGTNIILSNWANQSEEKKYNDENGCALKVYEESYIFENFILPQNIGTVTLKFRVTVNNPNGTSIDLGNGETQKDIAVSIPTETVKEWNPGNAYNYSLTISGETFGLKPIQFDDITVKDWNNNNDVNMTDNVTNVMNP